MMIGLPGSGKSTYAKNLARTFNKDGVAHISSDDIRDELFGGYNKEQTTQVFEEMHRRVKLNLKYGKVVIYDATNINRKKRKHFINHIARGYDVHAVFIYEDWEACVERNVHDVGLPVIKSYLRSFNVPLLSEGFKSLKTINRNNQWSTTEIKEFIRSYSKYMDYDQQSPYHSLTLGNHIKATWDKMVSELSALRALPKGSVWWLNYTTNWACKHAAILHDIGKPIAAYSSKDGKIRYTGHENISSYLAVPFYAPETGMGHYVHTLISYHMRMHDSNLKVDKLVSQIGKKEYEMLKLLNKCDKAAH